MVYKILILFFIVNFMVAWILNIRKKQREFEVQDIYSLQTPKPFRLYLLECGPEKIKIIQLIRQFNNSLDLVAAKDITENVPSIITEVDTKAEAEGIKQQFQLRGAQVEIQSVHSLQ